MSNRITRRHRRAALGLPALLSLALGACSGSGDAVTGPEQPEPPPQHHPAPAPNPAPIPNDPEPQQPIVAGSYVLASIDAATPGQTVSIANPDGILVGLYRFQASSTLVVDPLQTWSLQLQFEDDKQSFVIDDMGDLTWTGTEAGIALHFRSDTYGDAFSGLARNGLVSIEYDFDGDGRPDTVFGFVRTGN